jgi:hypothetical protein
LKGDPKSSGSRTKRFEIWIICSSGTGMDRVSCSDMFFRLIQLAILDHHGGTRDAEVSALFSPAVTFLSPWRKITNKCLPSWIEFARGRCVWMLFQEAARRRWDRDSRIDLTSWPEKHGRWHSGQVQVLLEKCMRRNAQVFFISGGSNLLLSHLGRAYNFQTFFFASYYFFSNYTVHQRHSQRTHTQLWLMSNVANRMPESLVELFQKSYKNHSTPITKTMTFSGVK